MKILILGGDGYIGFPLACNLAMQGHSIHIIDSYVKRLIGGPDVLFDSGDGLALKLDKLADAFGTNVEISHSYCNALDLPHLHSEYIDFSPDTVINMISCEGIDGAEINEHFIEHNLYRIIKPECNYIKVVNHAYGTGEAYFALKQGNISASIIVAPTVFGLMSKIGLVREENSKEWYYDFGIQTRIHYGHAFSSPVHRIMLRAMLEFAYNESNDNEMLSLITLDNLIEAINIEIDVGGNGSVSKVYASPVAISRKNLIRMVYQAAVIEGYCRDFSISTEDQPLYDPYFFTYCRETIRQLKPELKEVNIRVL